MIEKQWAYQTSHQETLQACEVGQQPCRRSTGPTGTYTALHFLYHTCSSSIRPAGTSTALRVLNQACGYLDSSAGTQQACMYLNSSADTQQACMYLNSPAPHESVLHLSTYSLVELTVFKEDQKGGQARY